MFYYHFMRTDICWSLVAFSFFHLSSYWVGIPAECHTPEYHIELNLIRELVKLVWYSSYMNLECQTPEHHIVDWMHVIQWLFWKAAGQLRPLRHHIYRGAVVGVRGAAVGVRGAAVGVRGAAVGNIAKLYLLPHSMAKLCQLSDYFTNTFCSCLFLFSRVGVCFCWLYLGDNWLSNNLLKVNLHPIIRNYKLSISIISSLGVPTYLLAVPLPEQDLQYHHPSVPISSPPPVHTWALYYAVPAYRHAAEPV